MCRREASSIVPWPMDPQKQKPSSGLRSGLGGCAKRKQFDVDVEKSGGLISAIFGPLGELGELVLSFVAVGLIDAF